MPLLSNYLVSFYYFQWHLNVLAVIYPDWTFLPLFEFPGLMMKACLPGLSKKPGVGSIELYLVKTDKLQICGVVVPSSRTLRHQA
jgi:hypothetical protein